MSSNTEQSPKVTGTFSSYSSSSSYSRVNDEEPVVSGHESSKSGYYDEQGNPRVTQENYNELPGSNQGRVESKNQFEALEDEKQNA